MSSMELRSGLQGGRSNLLFETSLRYTETMWDLALTCIYTASSLENLVFSICLWAFSASFMTKTHSLCASQETPAYTITQLPRKDSSSAIYAWARLCQTRIPLLDSVRQKRASLGTEFLASVLTFHAKCYRGKVNLATTERRVRSSGARRQFGRMVLWGIFLFINNLALLETFKLVKLC